MKNWRDDYATIDDSSDTPGLLGVYGVPGGSGVSVVRLRFASGHHQARVHRHVVKFELNPGVDLDSELSSEAVCRRAAVGSFVSRPADTEYACEVKETVDTLMIAIQPGRLALPAVEGCPLGAELRARLSLHDKALFHLARTLVLEGAADYPNGPHYWNEVADTFLDGLVTRHASGTVSVRRGMLDKATLLRIKDYVLAHLGDPIGVAALAEIARLSPFHFCRVFSRSAGMSPHRYIVHLRLQCAVGLVREGRCGFAEIALRTGFADQSHLSRWIERVYGVSLRQLAR
jgi:AraC family transcriptional regulator